MSRCDEQELRQRNPLKEVWGSPIFVDSNDVSFKAAAARASAEERWTSTEEEAVRPGSS